MSEVTKADVLAGIGEALETVTGLRVQQGSELEEGRPELPLAQVYWLRSQTAAESANTRRPASNTSLKARPPPDPLCRLSFIVLPPSRNPNRPYVLVPCLTFCITDLRRYRNDRVTEWGSAA